MTTVVYFVDYSLPLLGRKPNPAILASLGLPVVSTGAVPPPSLFSGSSSMVVGATAKYFELHTRHRDFHWAMDFLGSLPIEFSIWQSFCPIILNSPVKQRPSLPPPLAFRRCQKREFSHDCKAESSHMTIKAF